MNESKEPKLTNKPICAAASSIGKNQLLLKSFLISRNYFLHQISLLLRPRTNVRMIQVNSLLKYKGLMGVMRRDGGGGGGEVWSEVKYVYSDGMSRVIGGLFKTYSTQLNKLDAKVVTKSDLLGSESPSNPSLQAKRSDPFSLGNRGRVLDLIDEKPILVHVALAEKEHFPYEMLFRSLHRHLIDCATNEFIFIRDFFADSQSHHATFNTIFTKTLSLILESLENYLFHCHDIISLMCMINITSRHREVMQDRNITVLNNFFDRVSMLLWPRLKCILDAHQRSIKNAPLKKLSCKQCHFVSRRYAEFASSIRIISGGGSSGRSSGGAEEGLSGGASMIVDDLARLHANVVDGLLSRLADLQPALKQKLIFLINNLDLIETVFAERRVSSIEVTQVGELLKQHREKFVEEELQGCFSKMIRFVKQTESQMARGEGTKIDSDLVGSLVRDFGATWKMKIEQINTNVMSYFMNLRNGMEILKQVLTQLLLYYTRFQDIIRKAWKRNLPAFCSELVSNREILAEIKCFAMNV